MKTPSGSIRST